MTKKLVIIMPAYNEEATIVRSIRRVLSARIKGVSVNLVVIDDGSTDRTKKELVKIKNKRIRVLSHRHNLGKGAAIRAALEKTKGDIFVIQDADLEYDPNDYVAVIKPILDGKTEVVNGVRIQPERDERRKKSLYWISWFANHTITWLTNILYFHYSKEYEGCYKAFTKKLIDSIEVKTNNFDFDNELICKILKRGYKIIDVPIRYYPRSYEEGKKINWKHGFLILWTIIRQRFTD